MAHLSKRVPEFCAGDTMESFIWGTQMAQATAVRHTLEAYRCRWPESTGICYYKLTDVYPACSWSTIDYYGVPKLSYYAIKDSYEPLHACILFSSMRMEEDVKLPVYLLDDADRLDGSAWSVQVRAYDENLHVISEAVYSGRDSANVTYLGHLPVDRADAGSGPVLLTAEVYVEDTFYWFNYQQKQGCLLALPGTTLTCNVKEGHVVISNTGDVPAVGVTVECPDRDTEFVTESSLFWLNPGEVKCIAVSHTDSLVVRAWNAPEATER